MGKYANEYNPVHNSGVMMSGSTSNNMFRYSVNENGSIFI